MHHRDRANCEGMSQITVIDCPNIRAATKAHRGIPEKKPLAQLKLIMIWKLGVTSGKIDRIRWETWKRRQSDCASCSPSIFISGEQEKSGFLLRAARVA